MLAACRRPGRAQRAPRVRVLMTQEGQGAKVAPAPAGTWVEVSPCLRSTSLMRISYPTVVRAARGALAGTAELPQSTVILTKSAAGGILRPVEEVRAGRAGPAAWAGA